MPQKDNAPELVRIFPDQPVGSADGLDFQFDGLARTLAELAWNPDNEPPFTAVIRGGWGRGKTTLPRQTECLLRDEGEAKDERRTVRPIWFNACKYPSDDTVLAGLLGALLDELRQGSLIDQVKFHVDSHKTEFLEKIVQISLDLPEISHSGASDYVRTLVEKTPLRALLLGDGEESRNDSMVIARVLGSRHPRHVKRFLNDLAMSLAVLRNTGHLGEEDEEYLPPRSVVAWDLLREALPEERWREVRALPANLDAFLRQWRAAREAGEEKKRPEGWDEDMRQLARAGDLDAHIALLDALAPDQRDRLVHTGSPPREVKRVALEAGRIALSGSDLVMSRGVKHIEWIDIPGGTFQMGSEQGYDNGEPVHEVKLSPYQVSKYPVTNAQYAAFVAATGATAPRHWQDGGIPEGKERHPVVYVSWDDANAYCHWLNGQSAQDGRKIGLLTEAQWE